jgi:phospholipid transport system substrate-binding protein
MVRRCRLLAPALFAAALFAAAGSAQDGPAPAATPGAAIETLHDGLVEVAAASADAPFEQRYLQIEPIIAATHDLPYIAELTIRRDWARLTEVQRQRFIDAFARLSVATYASRFQNLEAGMFAIESSQPVAGGRAQVLATLSAPSGETIPFEYVLHETDDAGWRIINILADNVSDLALKRAEYRRVLQDGSIDDLIADLERQAAEAGE